MRRILWVTPMLAACVAAVNAGGGHPSPVAIRPQRPPEPRTPEQDGLRLNVRAAVTHRGQVRTLSNEDIVHTGDAVRLDVQLEQAAEVVVLAVDGSGKPSLLYPGVGASVRLEAGDRIPLPSEFVLDTQTGVETLVVIASTRPMTQSAPALHALIAAVRDAPHSMPRRRQTPPRGGSASAGSAPPRDPAATARAETSAAPPVETAGDVLLSPRTRELGEALRSAPTRGFASRDRLDVPDRVGADSDGIVVWRLSLRHVP